MRGRSGRPVRRCAGARPPRWSRPCASGGRRSAPNWSSISPTPWRRSRRRRCRHASCWPPAVQLSEYRNWAEISADLAPHFERAQTLAADSPLRQQIARIAAATSDRRARTMAALRFVQDEIRYFAVTIGDGNYVPATADQTWSRRYGDCKGKVVDAARARCTGSASRPNPCWSTAMHRRRARRTAAPAPGCSITSSCAPASTAAPSGWTPPAPAIAGSMISPPRAFGWGLPIRAGGAELEALALRAGDAAD